jgi:hypothetical protein
VYSVTNGGTRYHSLLWHYATIWKVTGSIPDEVIGFFNSPSLSSRTMAPGSTQRLTEMSTRNITGSKGRLVHGVTTSLPSVSRFSKKCGSLYISQPYGPSWPVTGIALPFYFYSVINTEAYSTMGIKGHELVKKMFISILPFCWPNDIPGSWHSGIQDTLSHSQ